MATLTSLCPELLLSIIRHLDHHSLVALAFTNKIFPPFVNPFLYRTLDRCIYELQGWPAFTPPIKWHRALTARPDLAALVKRLSFWSCKELSCGPIFTSPREVVQLPKLPNLEVLEIEYCTLSNWDFKVGNETVEEDDVTGGGWSAFENLKEVYFRNEADVEGMQYRPSFEMLFSVFHVPSLEIIDMVLPEPIEPEDLHWTENLCKYSLPNLGALHLMNSQASVKTLSKILAITPNLHTLEYNFVQDLDRVRWDWDHEEGHYNEWADLATALLQVKGSLTDLAISVAYFYDDYADGEDVELEWVDSLWERRGWMGSLQSFTKLERLEIPLPVLLGWNPEVPSKMLRDVLPSNLKELCLRDDLVDMYKGGPYPWTPWESSLQYDLDFQFQNTVDCSPVIEQLRDYLTPFTQTHSNNQPLALKVLILKQTQGRFWRHPDVWEIGELCREANVEGIFLGQAKNWGDQVVELTVYDPKWSVAVKNKVSSSEEFEDFQYRYIRVPRRTFCHRYCKTTPDRKLRSVNWLPWALWENVLGNPYFTHKRIEWSQNANEDVEWNGCDQSRSASDKVDEATHSITRQAA